MRLPELPEHLLIIGGGYVAAEFAHIFSSLGSRVTMVIRGSGLLQGHDDTITMRFTDLAAKKWEIRNHTNVVEVRRSGARIELTCDNGSTVRGDALLVATGRVSNGDRLDAELAGIDMHPGGRIVVDEYQRTTARGVFALGDVSSDYQLKHVANHEARVVRHNLLQEWDDLEALAASDHRHVPSAVFTDPQIASVGLTENQAMAAGYKFKTKVQDYSDDHRRRGHRADPRSAPDGTSGVVADSARGAGDELRAARAGHGPWPVLDPPRATRGHRERAAGVVRRAALAPVAASLKKPGRLQSRKPCRSVAEPAM
jgi:pyruvate/2-oxoglutarate dehydrogenase complex dihydrolipoamide dehydrogenase (E3) component